MRTFLLIISLSISALTAAQNVKMNENTKQLRNTTNAEGFILWKDGLKLTWEDFQGKPQKGHFASALSRITFSIKIRSEGNELFVFIEPSFDPRQSWVKQDHKTDFLLEHEQKHFDIYELNARKFRKELKSKNLTRSNVEKTVNKLVDKYTKLNNSSQKKYDKSTNHSLKKEKQLQWNSKIDSELKELKAYSEPSFTVRIN